MTHQDVIKLLELQRAVKELPSRYGFSNLGDFIRALKEFDKAGSVTTSSAENSAPASSSTPETMETTSQPASNRKKRKRLTKEDKDKIVELVDAGQTSAEIADHIDCSVATVQNVKKERNKTKPRPKIPAPESINPDQS